jgi:putative oxidoreductase
MSLGSIVTRGVVGALFVGHGTQKLFGWFGGHGPEGTAGFFESLGLRPGMRHAKAAGWSETLGGALLMTGVATPVAASMITGTMVTAIRKVHAAKGPWVTEGGYEYNLVLLAAMLAVTEEKHGKAIAAGQLIAGAAGSYLATSPVVSETAAEEPASAEREDREGRFTRVEEPVTADA